MRNEVDRRMTSGFYHYSIGEMSKLLSMPAPTIRFYDSQGAVVPARNEENQYRMYTVVDRNYLLKVKELKNTGAGLSEIGRLLNEASLEEWQEGLRRIDREMERQIFWTNLRQEGIRRQLKRLERLEEELGRITIETRPPLWRYNHQKRERFEEGPGHIEARKAWTDALPASFQSFRLPQSDIEGGETGVGMLQWGYAMEADMVPGTGLDALPLSEYLPPCKCVRTVICTSNEVFLKLKYFQAAIKYLHDHAFILDGDLIGRSLARFTNGRGEVLHYYEGWFPIQNA